MILSRALALSLALAAMAVPMAVRAQEAEGDPERGKIIFRTTGGCVNCHGWPADGKTGVNMRSPTGSNLRESTLDLAGLIEVISCGRPGTEMPFHDRAAYRDDRCYGLVFADFDEASTPRRGKSLREADIASVAAYLHGRVIGLGKPTFDECVDFFDNPAAQACAFVK